MLERRYVLIDSRKRGDTFIDVLKAGITKEDALAEFEAEWVHHTREEQRKMTLQLAYLATYDGSIVDDLEDDEERKEAYNKAIAEKWDTITGYWPIAERSGDK